jgi:hypothetical protein
MRHREFIWLQLALTLVCSGCSGTDSVVGDSESSNYESLFSPPTSTRSTPNDIHGLWGGRVDLDPSLETRWRIDANRISVGLRCYDASQNFITVGVSVAARVDDRSIAALESKSDVKRRPDGTDCHINSAPDVVDYSISGTTLTLKGRPGISQQLVKIKD